MLKVRYVWYYQMLRFIAIFRFWMAKSDKNRLCCAVPISMPISQSNLLIIKTKIFPLNQQQNHNMQVLIMFQYMAKGYHIKSRRIHTLHIWTVDDPSGYASRIQSKQSLPPPSPSEEENIKNMHTFFSIFSFGSR